MPQLETYGRRTAFHRNSKSSLTARPTNTRTGTVVRPTRRSPSVRDSEMAQLALPTAVPVVQGKVDIGVDNPNFLLFDLRTKFAVATAVSVYDTLQVDRCGELSCSILNIPAHAK